MPLARSHGVMFCMLGVDSVAAHAKMLRQWLDEMDDKNKQEAVGKEQKDTAEQNGCYPAEGEPSIGSPL